MCFKNTLVLAPLNKALKNFLGIGRGKGSQILYFISGLLSLVNYSFMHKFVCFSLLIMKMVRVLKFMKEGCFLMKELMMLLLASS